MRSIKWFVFFFIIIHNAKAQQTPFEKSNGTKTATYFEAISWYKSLAIKSKNLLVKEMGATDAGYPLQLILVSSDGTHDPLLWHRQHKVVLLVNNGIHPGEPDGIDASMMLVRDIIDKKILLPQNVALAFIPVYNIGGCLNRNAYTRVNQNGPESYGFRGNSQNLDLNRDFTKNDSKEARSFALIFHYVNPEIFIDNHVSDGADYQHTMTLISTQYDKLTPLLGKFLKEKLEPALYKGMAQKKWDLIPYVDFETTDFNKGMQMFYDPPRYSSGYAALFNTLAFMPETHMLKPYKDRVKATYDLMATFIEAASANATVIISNKKTADSSMCLQQEFPLRWRPDSTTHTSITFKGYERDSAISEATGLKKMFYNHDKPFTRQIKYFDTFKAYNIVTKPAAYIIPQGWYQVAERLKINGIRLARLTQDSSVTVTAYHIDSYKSTAVPYEKHHPNGALQVTPIIKEIKFLKGDYIIYMDQPGNRYVVEMLQPTGDDSFFSWNFFDAVLQQKEGYSDYRWEDLAAAVLKTDTALNQRLQEKKAADPKFAANSIAVLDFIYKNSKYAEPAYLQYPVYRIEAY